MELKKTTYTNEALCKKFVSQFDLVNYAIRLAENMIQSGRDPRVKLDTQNKAMLVIAEIVQDKDQFDTIAEAPLDAIEPTRPETREFQAFSVGKSSEKKKSRSKIVSE